MRTRVLRTVALLFSLSLMLSACAELGDLLDRIGGGLKPGDVSCESEPGDVSSESEPGDASDESEPGDVSSESEPDCESEEAVEEAVDDAEADNIREALEGAA